MINLIENPSPTWPYNPNDIPPFAIVGKKHWDSFTTDQTISISIPVLAWIGSQTVEKKWMVVVCEVYYKDSEIFRVQWWSSGIFGETDCCLTGAMKHWQMLPQIPMFG